MGGGIKKYKMYLPDRSVCLSQYLFVFAFVGHLSGALRCRFVFTATVKLTTNGDPPGVLEAPIPFDFSKASQPCAESFVQCPFNYTHDFRFLQRRRRRRENPPREKHTKNWNNERKTLHPILFGLLLFSPVVGCVYLTNIKHIFTPDDDAIIIVLSVFSPARAKSRRALIKIIFSLDKKQEAPGQIVELSRVSRSCVLRDSSSGVLRSPWSNFCLPLCKYLLVAQNTFGRGQKARRPKAGDLQDMRLHRGK